MKQKLIRGVLLVLEMFGIAFSILGVAFTIMAQAQDDPGPAFHRGMLPEQRLAMEEQVNLLDDPGSAFHQGMMPEQSLAMEEHFNRLAQALCLNETQKDQIKSILRAEREEGASLHHKMAEINKKLHWAMRTDKFDESKVKRILLDEARLKTEIMAAQARARAQIMEQLTPTQRDLAEKLRPLFGPGPEPGPGPKTP